MSLFHWMCTLWIRKPLERQVDRVNSIQFFISDVLAEQPSGRWQRQRWKQKIHHINYKRKHIQRDNKEKITSVLLVKVKRIYKNNLFLSIFLVLFNSIHFTQVQHYYTPKNRKTETRLRVNDDFDAIIQLSLLLSWHNNQKINYRDSTGP